MMESLCEDQEKDDGFKVRDQLFDKFFRQLEKHALKLNSHNVCRALHCLDIQSRYAHVQKDTQALLDLHLRAKFLADRLADMLSREQDVTVLDLYWSNKFLGNIDRVLKSQLSEDQNYSPLDLRRLQLYSIQELQEHLETIEPKIIVNMMELFDNERHRKVLVNKTLECLREETIDIRKFHLSQLAKFIKYVSVYQPSDVIVFYNYIMTAFNSGFFKINKVNFNPISDIMLMFVKNGFLSPDN